MFRPRTKDLGLLSHLCCSLPFMAASRSPIPSPTPLGGWGALQVLRVYNRVYRVYRVYRVFRAFRVFRV